jgi:hypothetical protein
MFENRVLRRIFGASMDELRREWRRLRKEEIFRFVRLTKFYLGEIGKAFGWYGRQERGIQGFGGET